MTEFNDVQLAGPRLAIKVSELIRRAVQRSGMSQKQIAAAMDISESRLSQIVNGDGNFHTATLARVFAAAGCRLEVRAFDERGEEVEIVRRRRRTELANEATYVHTVEGEDGAISSVFSYSHGPVTGRPVDFPIRVNSAADVRRTQRSVEMLIS